MVFKTGSVVKHVNNILNFLIGLCLILIIISPGLNFVLGVKKPYYEVISGSMDYGDDFESWWLSQASCKNTVCTQKELYSSYNISESDFKSFDFNKGLKKGDFLIIRASDSYTVGDVIVYLMPDEKIVHRVIAIDEENVVTKGDANYDVTSKDLLDEKRILGKVIVKI